MISVAYRNTQRSIFERRKDAVSPKLVAFVMKKASEDAAHEADKILTKAKTEAEMVVARARSEAEVILAKANELAQKALGGDQPARVPVHDLISSVAAKHGVPYDMITGASRASAVVAIRHEAMALVYQKRPDLSLPQIGKFFGGRDHTTILHAVHKLGVHRPDHTYRKKKDAD